MAVGADLKAVLREERGKGPVRRLRAAGWIPAVLYGHREDTRVLSIDSHELERLLSRISVENTLITLDIEGEKGPPVRALVRDLQVHPFKPEVVHLDFYQIHAGERVDVEIPIELTGNAAGVKMGGILQQVLHDLAITCLPDQIPEKVEVDVSLLEIGDSIHVHELSLAEGVDVETDTARTVCSVVAPTVVALEPEEEEAVTEGVGGEVQPELIRKRPGEEETPPATKQGGHEEGE